MTTVRKEGFIHSQDQTKLYFCQASPPEKNGTPVLILHGYGEHCRRYDHVVDALVGAGFAPLTFDFRGHGQSHGTRGLVRRVEEYTWDINAAMTQLHGKLGPKTLLLAHSMGGAAALSYGLHHADRIQALALSSPYLGRALAVNPIKLGLGHVLGKIAPFIGLPSGLTGEMVSQDPEVQKAYGSDPLNNKNATAGWFVATEALHERLRHDLSTLNIPLLVAHGDADPIASIDAARSLFERWPHQDKTFKAWPGLRHEPLNEKQPDRQAVINTFVEWLKQHA